MKSLYTGKSTKEKISRFLSREHLEFSKTNEFYTYTLKLLYTRCSMKEAISLLLSRNTYYFKKKWLLHMQFGLLVANQNRKKKIKRGYYTFSNCYIQGAPWKKQYHCSFRGALKISRMNDFYRSILGELWDIKIIIKKNQDTICFEIATHWAPHERCNNTALFAKHLNFKKKWLLQKRFGWDLTK